MSVVAAILAAGKGVRFGQDKTQISLQGRPLWRWSHDAFSAHPKIDRVIVITSPESLETFRAEGIEAYAGGNTRQESSLRALDTLEDDDLVLIHDAARPFVSVELIDSIIEAVRTSGAAAPATPVTDTIKQRGPEGVRTLDRSSLVAMQTPQGAKVRLLRMAHAQANAEHTDEMALLESAGVKPTLVEGDPRNFKITHPDDLQRARGLLGSGETRVGFGYDVHPFSADPTRMLFLGGIHFPDHPALDGHSDADVLLHAIADALLGAAALGDIGVHFPNTDERWKGAPSLIFVREVSRLLAEAGWEVVHVDATVVAESPKIMARALEIRQAVCRELAVEVDRVSVKATTNEKLGFIGRHEGMVAMATATVRKL